MSHASLVPDVVLPELGLATGFMVFAVRSLVVGRGSCQCVVRCFDQLLKEDAGAAHADMAALVSLIGHHGARKVMIAGPGCSRITFDELLIVKALEAMQNEDWSAAHRISQDLFGGEPPLGAHELLDNIAVMFSVHSLCVSSNGAEAQAQTEWLVKPTVSAIGTA
ncbi:MAG: hypothetical protein AAGB03_09125 [Pseudomonadota bacterium]